MKFQVGPGALRTTAMHIAAEARSMEVGKCCTEPGDGDEVVGYFA